MSKKELLDALYSMYMQYCNDKWGHRFMGAGEKASELLENAGYIVVDNIGAIVKDNYNYGDWSNLNKDFQPTPTKQEEKE